MFIDLLFLLSLVGILTLGFFQGIIRVAILLVAFYLSVVMASFFFGWLGGIFVRNFHTSVSVGQYLAFAVIMITFLILLSLAGFYQFRDIHLPGQLMYVDRVAGMVVSLLLAGLILGMMAVLLWNLFIERGAANIDFPVMKLLGRSIRSSFLLQYFANHVLPGAYNFADPILPDSARFIFNPPAETPPEESESSFLLLQTLFCG
jgi:membrane protein required for colicin V production